jgi:glyoxylase-like metal-dependent hydrolase (beta-lactamase superfamily II)
VNTRIHHLNCLTLHPRVSFGGRLAPTRWVAHCLLVERSDGLALVDSGLGTGDLAKPSRLGRGFALSMRPELDLAATALRQVEALGFTREDVRDIVLTHLDVDHAGGIGDFPNARIHVDATEHLAAEKPRTLMEKQRYVQAQWSHHPDWALHGSGGDDWFGFEGVRGLDEDVLLVPLRGHTRGHSGVAVRRPEGGWLLHGGDSYFYKGEVETPPTYTKGQTAFQKLMAVDEKSRRANQQRLRELRMGHPDVTIFSAHDAIEFDRLAGS